MNSTDDTPSQRKYRVKHTFSGGLNILSVMLYLSAGVGGIAYAMMNPSVVEWPLGLPLFGLAALSLAVFHGWMAIEEVPR